MKQYLSTIKGIIAGLVVVASVSAAYAGTYVAPTGAPTGGNAEAPINVSVAAQSKAGNFGAGKFCDTALTNCLSLSEILNSSASVQTKAGNLTVGGVNKLFTTGFGTTFFRASNDAIFDAEVGIGALTNSGTLKLDVEGDAGATRYCDNTGANCFTAGQVTNVVNSSGVTKIIAGPGVSVNPIAGTGDVTVTNTGVTKIIAGTGITVTPIAGTTEVTVNADMTQLVPAGAVMAFNLQSCPTGWVTDIYSQGRYIVGQPPGGVTRTRVGTALEVGENRSVGAHTHGYYGESVTTGSGASKIVGHHGNNDGISTVVQQGHGATTIKTGDGVGSVGNVAGTNAPYVQYLMCIKQ